MKIGEAVTYMTDALKEMYDEDESKTIAQMILEDCTGQTRSFLLLNKAEALSANEEERLKERLNRLQHHEPVQYVLNKSWFYGMELYIDKNVLIPRPETEELVDWILKDIKLSGLAVFERGSMQADVTNTLKILDIGTGSGCIALALKKAMPKAEVWGCDISEEALNIARRNGSSLDIRVDFQGIDFLDEAQQRFLPTVDIIVSNPPYVPLKDKESMRPNVLQYEPHTALFVPDNDPLLFYKAIAQFAEKRLHDKGAIYLEIHEELGGAVAAIFKPNKYQQVEVRKDMQGKERMVKVSRGPGTA
jgi:release factor glutamine methyltransferase